MGDGHGASSSKAEENPMQYEYLDCEIRDGIAHVSLLGPGSPAVSVLCDEVLDLMLRLQEDDKVRVILIVDGEGAFDMGPDLLSLAQSRCDGKSFESLAPDLDIIRKTVTIIQDIAKPVVAATRGDVRESGLGLYLAADVRVASSTATFTPPGLICGLLPDWGLSFTLPRLVGPSRSLDLIWSGQTISAAQADRLGLVDRLIPDEVWEEELSAYLDRLRDLPQPAVRLTKLSAQQALQFDMTSMLSYEYEAQQQCWDSRETAEGMAAFLDGRSPQFSPPIAEEEEE
jgi:2-(1,2-epoxy-1,2-dihydrophenyl)acetyl-CoA isomerase